MSDLADLLKVPDASRDAQDDFFAINELYCFKWFYLYLITATFKHDRHPSASGVYNSFWHSLNKKDRVHIHLYTFRRRRHTRDR